MARFPYGYGSATTTLSDLERRYGSPMHPEYRRRLFAWLASRGGAIGIGSAARPFGATTSAASRAGHSFHQRQRFADGNTYVTAVDLVAKVRGGIHRAPRWSEVPRQGSEDAALWGLHANVSGEPWHLQPIELDGFQSWASRGRPLPRSGYPLPSGGGPAIPSGAPSFDPPSSWGLFPLDRSKPTLRSGSYGDHVRYLQAAILHHAGGAIAVDGRYGAQTVRRVRDLQRVFRLSMDGVCGRRTWGAVDHLVSSR